MLLSIIIVSWNARAYLNKCLISLESELAQLPSEVIVVDNASTDGSEELVRNYYPHVKLFCNSKNLGFAKANNIGIRQSKGEYVALLNSDIEVQAGCFKRMLQFMEKNPRVGMCGPKILNPDGTLQLSCFSLPTAWNMLCRALALDSLFPKSRLFGSRMMTFFPHDTTRGVEMLNGCFLVVRRQALDVVGLLDESFFFYGEDIDWAKRFCEAGWGIVFFHDAQAVHYGGASSANSPIRFYIEMHRADCRYWKKHYGHLGQVCFFAIAWLHHILRIIGAAARYIIMPEQRADSLFKIRRSLACIRWLARQGSADCNAS